MVSSERNHFPFSEQRSSKHIVKFVERGRGYGIWTQTSVAQHKRWVSSEAMLVPWTLSTALVSSIASVAVGFSASASLGVVAKHGEPRALDAKYVIHDASR